MRLLVIGQVNVTGRKSTVNRALNTVLNQYAKNFSRVFYFGPRHLGVDMGESVNVEFYDTDVYSRTKMGRLKFMASRRLYGELDRVIQEVQPDLIEIRVPAPLTIRAGLYLKRKYAHRMYCYVAGDVTEAVSGNYPLPGIRFVAEVMARWQDRLLAGLPVVATGDALRNKLMLRHGGKLRCHPYYSTTHDRILYGSHRRNELLVIGRLEPLKRPHLAVETLGELHRRGFRDFTLRFLGEGALEDSLSRLAESLEIRDHVIFHGYERDSDALSEIYLGAKFLLHPSMTEGTSKVLAEAMAHGVIPIAIAGVGSNDHILESGAGYLIGPNKDEMTESVLDSIVNNNILSQKMESGYQYARNHTLESEVGNLFRWIKSEL